MAKPAGVLDVAEHIRLGTSWNKIKDRTVKAQLEFRAIKFNLPWSAYRTSPALEQHQETCKDLRYWEAFLDMMVENRFNVLSLWSLHPYTYMIRPKNFPEACPFSDAEMAEWKKLWTGIFAMAKERGIEMTESLVGAGCRVTIIEARDQILPAIDCVNPFKSTPSTPSTVASESAK